MRTAPYSSNNETRACRDSLILCNNTAPTSLVSAPKVLRIRLELAMQFAGEIARLWTTVTALGVAGAPRSGTTATGLDSAEESRGPDSTGTGTPRIR